MTGDWIRCPDCGATVHDSPGGWDIHEHIAKPNWRGDWPIHEYDPRPGPRRARRAMLVSGEYIAREVLCVMVPATRWLSETLARIFPHRHGRQR